MKVYGNDTQAKFERNVEAHIGSALPLGKSLSDFDNYEEIKRVLAQMETAGYSPKEAAEALKQRQA